MDEPRLDARQRKDRSFTGRAARHRYHQGERGEDCPVRKEGPSARLRQLIRWRSGGPSCLFFREKNKEKHASKIPALYIKMLGIYATVQGIFQVAHC